MSDAVPPPPPKRQLDEKIVGSVKSRASRAAEAINSRLSSVPPVVFLLALLSTALLILIALGSLVDHRQYAARAFEAAEQNYAAAQAYKGERDDAMQQLALVGGELEATQTDLERLDDAVARAERAEERAEREIARLADRLESEYEARIAELSELEAELEARAEELGAQAEEVAEREAAVGQQEQRQAENSFGSGRFEVGVDIDPGTYRTDGSSSCYWARLRSSDRFDIIDNHFGSGSQVVQISAGQWFESQDCGTWRRR